MSFKFYCNFIVSLLLLDLGLFCILYTVLVIALGNLYITYQSLAVSSFYIFECSQEIYFSLHYLPSLICDISSLNIYFPYLDTHQTFFQNFFTFQIQDRKFKKRRKVCYVYQYFWLLYLPIILFACLLLIFVMLCVNPDSNHQVDIEEHAKQGRSSYINNYVRRNLKKNTVQIC